MIIFNLRLFIGPGKLPMQGILRAYHSWRGKTRGLKLCNYCSIVIVKVSKIFMYLGYRNI
jgi:hypothetical protein